MKAKEGYAFKILLIALLIFSFASFDCHARKKRPDWVDGQSKDYPSPRYFIGIGATTSKKCGKKQCRQWAADSARAEVSKTLRTQIEVTTVSRREVESKKSGKKKNLKSESSMTNQVVATSGELLEGVEIKEYYKDRKSKMIYALAVLDRMKAENIVKSKIQKLQKNILNEMTAGKEYLDDKNYLKSIGRYNNAYSYAELITPQRELLAVLMPVGSNPMGGDVYYKTEVDAILRKLKKHVKFKVDISGPAKSVKSSIVRGLGKYGFLTSGGNSQTKVYRVVGMSDVTYRGPTEVGSNFKVEVYNAELNMEVQSADTGESIGAIFWQINANEKTKVMAEKSAIRSLGKLVEKEIGGKIVDL